MIGYNSRYTQVAYNKAIMKPLFVKNASEPEQIFMELLSQSDKIKWWFKNGENDSKYLRFYIKRKMISKEHFMLILLFYLMMEK